jgi:mevalonate kinase
MTEVQASAPGKVILFGEHSVVYGRPAIAAPVFNVAANAAIEPGGRDFKVVARDLGLVYHLPDAPPDDPLAETINATLHHFGLSTLPPGTLTVTSTIPLGRGLGSGAAISTAIIRALAQLMERPISPAEVSALVFEIEKLHHGTPSGIDNTVIAFEQPVYFIKDKPIRRMRVARPFTLLIGDTGVAASTRAVVGNLRARREADTERFEGYFDEIAVIARHAKNAIEQPVFEVRVLGKLMNENQEILEAVGVSSPELERLVAAARNAGAWGAKLSGAGWGGNMIALVPPDSNTVAAVKQALLDAGAAGVIQTEVR